MINVEENKKKFMIIGVILVVIIAGYIVYDYGLLESDEQVNLKYETISEDPTLPYITTESEIRIKNLYDENNFKLYNETKITIEEDVDIENINYEEVAEKMIEDLGLIIENDSQFKESLIQGLKIDYQAYQEGVTETMIFNFEEEMIWIKDDITGEWIGEEIEEYQELYMQNKEEVKTLIESQPNDEKDFEMEETILNTEIPNFVETMNMQGIEVEEREMKYEIKVNNFEKSVSIEDDLFMVEDYDDVYDDPPIPQDPVF